MERNRAKLLAAVLRRWADRAKLERSARNFLRARGLESRRTQSWARRALKAWRSGSAAPEKPPAQPPERGAGRGTPSPRDAAREKTSRDYGEVSAVREASAEVAWAFESPRAPRN